MAIDAHKLEKEEREHALARLGAYVRAERDEEWGDLAVMLLLDAFEEQIAPLYYNRGITSAQKAMRDLADSVEENLEVLKRIPPAPSGR
ncbi:MAG: DUF2164 domain-containing protein [Dehalococcoidia bacterium]|nr:DUF2164 domain-containing protein [Dehalococcoidia bacterium]